MLWHNTFLVNSLAHVMGRRRYVTDDTSRNSLLIAITTLGEGWHNNHHYYQASARNGFFWWEIDVTFYVLKALSWVGLVRDLKVPTPEILAANRIADGNFDVGTYKSHWARAQAAVAHSHADGEQPDAVVRAIEIEKLAVDDDLHRAMASAEQLARVTRRANKDLGLLDG